MAVVNQLNLNVGTEQNPNFVLHDINDKRVSTTAVTTATHILTCNSGVTSIAPITAANLASVLGVKETVSLSSGTDLNGIKDTTKIYTCSSATIASSLVNCPVSVGFKMYVISVNTVDTPTAPRVAQVIIANYENGNVYIRKILGSSVSNWYLHSGTVV